MKYRRFTYNGEFLDVLFTTDGEFSVPPEDQIVDIATALGVDPTTIKATDASFDPAEKEPLIPVPPAEQVVEETLEDRVARLEATVAASQVLVERSV